MNANEFKELMFKSHGLAMIVTGLVELVENEGYSPHETFELLDKTKQNLFFALAEIGSGEKNEPK